MKKVTQVNYTENQTSEMVKAYKAAESEIERDTVVSNFAEDFGKSLASIRAKLSREGVYIKKAYVSKAGVKPQRKAAKVSQIADFSAKDPEFFDSLEKATANVLDELIYLLSK